MINMINTLFTKFITIELFKFNFPIIILNIFINHHVFLLKRKSITITNVARKILFVEKMGKNSELVMS